MTKSLIFFSELGLCLFNLLPGALAQPGALDLSFNPGTGVNGFVYCMTLDREGRIVVGGSFLFVNGATRHQIAKFNSDGSLNTDFNPGEGPDQPVYAMAVQTNGAVVIGGTFATVNSISRNGLARLRSDGSLDLAFNPVLSAGARAYAAAIQSDGKIVIGGVFDSVNGIARNRIARLNSDGSLDLDFNPGTGANDEVHSVAVQTNGSILIGGLFTTIDNSNRSHFARLNPNGSLDTGFDSGFIGGGQNSTTIRAIVASPDGNSIVAGGFTSINGYSRVGIARILSDGSVDSGFQPPSLNFDARSIAIQPDNKVIVGGNFSYGSPSRCCIVRLNANGSTDPSFYPVLNGGVRALAVQPDGKVLAGGDFTVANGTNINRIARFTGDGSPPADLQFLDVNRYFGGYISGTVSNSYRVEWTTNLNTPSLWTPLFNVTLQTNPQFIVDPTPISARQRYYRAVALP